MHYMHIPHLHYFLFVCVPVTNVTNNENKGKSNISALSPEQEGEFFPMGATVRGFPLTNFLLCLRDRKGSKKSFQWGTLGKQYTGGGELTLPTLIQS